jgi:hypothetical protein
VIAQDEDEDPLNSSLTPMDWLPRLNAKAGMVEVSHLAVTVEEKRELELHRTPDRISLLSQLELELEVRDALQAEVPEEQKKPPYSYAALIRLAIINSDTQKVVTANRIIVSRSPGHPVRHLPVDPAEVPLLPAPDQPGLEEQYQAQPEPEQVLHEGGAGPAGPGEGLLLGHQPPTFP